MSQPPSEWIDKLGVLLRAGRYARPLPPEPKRRRVIPPKPPTIGPSGWARRGRPR